MDIPVFLCTFAVGKHGEGGSPSNVHAQKKGSRSRPFLIKAILLALCLELLPYQQIGRNTLQPCFLLSFALSPWLLPCYGAKLFLSPFCSCFLLSLKMCLPCKYTQNNWKTKGKHNKKNMPTFTSKHNVKKNTNQFKNLNENFS